MYSHNNQNFQFVGFTSSVLLNRIYLAVMRLYLFGWPKSLLIVNYIIKSLYSIVKINLEYFHCITYCMMIIQELDGMT